MYCTNKESSKSNEIETHANLQCKWKKCFLYFKNTKSLDKHINEMHVKKSKHLSCYWENCSRNNKPLRSERLLLKHTQAHYRDKLYECDVSNKMICGNERIFHNLCFRSFSNVILLLSSLMIVENFFQCQNT